MIGMGFVRHNTWGVDGSLPNGNQGMMLDATS